MISTEIYQTYPPSISSTHTFTHLTIHYLALLCSPSPLSTMWSTLSTRARPPSPYKTTRTRCTMSNTTCILGSSKSKQSRSSGSGADMQSSRSIRQRTVTCRLANHSPDQPSPSAPLDPPRRPQRQTSITPYRCHRPLKYPRKHQTRHK
jgi:hypothetical protein